MLCDSQKIRPLFVPQDASRRQQHVRSVQDYLDAARRDDSLLHLVLHTLVTGSWVLPDVPVGNATGAEASKARRHLLYPKHMAEMVHKLHHYFTSPGCLPSFIAELGQLCGKQGPFQLVYDQVRQCKYFALA